MNKSESKYFNSAVKMDRALITLLKQKPLDYITVSEICATAGVNRSTFYLHYETIGDLLAETTQLLLNDFAACFTADARSAVTRLHNCPPEELIFIQDEFVLPYLSFVREHKEVFEIAFAHHHTLGFADVYQKMYDNIFDPILDRFHYPQDDRPFVMTYYLNGIHALVLEWLKRGCAKPIEEIAQIITVCIFGRQ